MKNFGLVAYSSKTGLGYQTKAIYDNLNPFKTMVVDLSKYNRMPTNHSEWYKWSRVVDGIPTKEDINHFLINLDTVFVCETPLNYYLFEEAKRRGIRVIQQCNPEFLDFFKHPEFEKPTVLANPTSYMSKEIGKLGLNQQILRVPIDLKDFRKIREVKTITHITGRPTFQDRNGTLEFLKMAEKLGNRFDYLLFLQKPKDIRAEEYFKPIKKELDRILSEGNLPITVVEDVQDNQAMYLVTDLLVLPRGYAGLCLPMNEALAHGIPVIMPNIEPNNDILPKTWLCEASSVGVLKLHADVEMFKANIESLCETIEGVSREIEIHREVAYQIAKGNSWSNLIGNYYSVINGEYQDIYTD